MKNITVKTDETKQYLNPSDALSDQGYYVRETRNGLMATKDGQDFSVKSYDHYNTSVFSVKLSLLK
jgi:hypothetical protein